jgi:hypothetical protein
VPRHPPAAEEKKAEHHGHHPHPPDKVIVQMMELRGRVMALEPHPVPATYLAELIDLLVGHDAEDPPVVGDQGSRAHRVHEDSHVAKVMERHAEAEKAEAEKGVPLPPADHPEAESGE